MTPEQLAKLPRWAQDEVAQLTREAANLKYQLDQFRGATDSPMSLRAGGMLASIPIPEGIVRFAISKDKWIDARLLMPSLDHADGGIAISAAHTISLIPQANNHIRIMLPERWGTV